MNHRIPQQQIGRNKPTACSLLISEHPGGQKNQ